VRGVAHSLGLLDLVLLHSDDTSRYSIHTPNVCMIKTKKNNDDMIGLLPALHTRAIQMALWLAVAQPTLRADIAVPASLHSKVPVQNLNSATLSAPPRQSPAAPEPLSTARM